jgi:NAD(P)H-dependent FMN reductase
LALRQTKSIRNKQLASYATGLFENTATTLLDLNDFEMPICQSIRKMKMGIPQLAYDFIQKLINFDLVVISFANFNGAYSSSFKKYLGGCVTHQQWLFSKNHY